MVRYSLGKRAPARACRFESCPHRQNSFTVYIGWVCDMIIMDSREKGAKSIKFQVL